MLVSDSGNAPNTQDPATWNMNINYAELTSSNNIGAVGYNYSIGKYEVTIGQYTAFLNSVAASDPHGLWKWEMGEDPYSAPIIRRSGSSGSYLYSVIGANSNKPISLLTWFDAARFTNWLANGQPIGPQNSSTTEDGAYALNGNNDGLVFTRNRINPNTGMRPKYWIPSDNEWYKAAYYNHYQDFDTNLVYYADRKSNAGVGNTRDEYDNYYVTHSNRKDYYNWDTYLTDVGSFSPNLWGIYDMEGNVSELIDSIAVSRWDHAGNDILWTDSMLESLESGDLDLSSLQISAIIRGASYDSNYWNPQYSKDYLYNIGSQYRDDVGFRVAGLPDVSCAPEPSQVASSLVLIAGLVGYLAVRNRLGPKLGFKPLEQALVDPKSF